VKAASARMGWICQTFTRVTGSVHEKFLPTAGGRGGRAGLWYWKEPSSRNKQSRGRAASRTQGFVYSLPAQPIRFALMVGSRVAENRPRDMNKQMEGQGGVPSIGRRSLSRGRLPALRPSDMERAVFLPYASPPFKECWGDSLAQTFPPRRLIQKPH
jgi:hypothetical protein